MNDDSYFTECIILKNPINVRVGDGRSLKGTKVSKVGTYIFAKNLRTELTISNVFYVKDIDKNLLSFAKVTDNNKIIAIGETADIYDMNEKSIGIACKGTFL